MGIFDMFKRNRSSFEDLYESVENHQSWQLDKKIESQIAAWDEEKKSLLLLDIINGIGGLKEENWASTQRRVTFEKLASFLTKGKAYFKDYQKEILRKLLETTNKFNEENGSYYFFYTLKPIIANALKCYKFENQEDRHILSDIKTALEEFDKRSFNNDLKKTIQKIGDVLFESASGGAGLVKPVYFVGDDGFQSFANTKIEGLEEAKRQLFFKILNHAQKATGAKPSQKYLNESKVLVEAFGDDGYSAFSQELFEFVISLKEETKTLINNYSGSEYSYQTIEFLNSMNADTLKGLVWMSFRFNDNKTLTIIGKLAERCFKKIPGKGQAAAALGNACLFMLYTSEGLDGIAQLSKLKIKVKQSSTVDLIEKYILEAASNLGISPAEVEDLAVDDFKISDGKLEVLFGDARAVVELTGIGKSIIRWYKEDGKEQKTVPQTIKDNFANELKNLKDKQKQIDQTASVQKERLDRMFRSERVFSLSYFVDKYLNHGLLSFVINKVIFKFSNGDESVLAIFLNKKLMTIEYKEIAIDKYKSVSLWHPATSSTHEVSEWRQFLMSAEIQQPLKQAYREIYLLTEAEINTRTYSNRMASHVLKQHQYVMLAKGRNWRATLIGSWDGGDQDTALLNLPEHNIRAEYWVNALNADNEWNDTGIWNYVTTDQVRFINTRTNDLLELSAVPKVVFSEVMRDVDLFVGVASVGNDPTWSDSGGLPLYRDYWQSYSFGDLSEVAKNRKEILQGLIPRLKIASVASISDKFLVVKGKLRTYKIHIGSTNILMEPNDQYLCIVPDRSKKNEYKNLFLPFEGDTGLSIIISKAFLLANDDKITDSSITSQIKR